MVMKTPKAKGPDAKEIPNLSFEELGLANLGVLWAFGVLAFEILAA